MVRPQRLRRMKFRIPRIGLIGEKRRLILDGKFAQQKSLGDDVHTGNPIQRVPCRYRERTRAAICSEVITGRANQLWTAAYTITCRYTRGVTPTAFLKAVTKWFWLEKPTA